MVRIGNGLLLLYLLNVNWPPVGGLMIVDHHYHVRLVHNEYDIKPSDTRHRQAYVRGE